MIINGGENKRGGTFPSFFSKYSMPCKFIIFPTSHLRIAYNSLQNEKLETVLQRENNFSNCIFVCRFGNTAQVKTEKKKVIKTSKSTWKGRKLWTVCWNKPLKNYFPVSIVGFQSLPKTKVEEGTVLPMHFILSQFWFTAAGSSSAISSTLADLFT